MSDRVGQQLGNYRLVRLLGTGGFAEVYLGEQIYLATQAAIKVLQTRLAEDEQEHFLTEARLVAHLIHPHIVRVLEFGVEAEIPYLVMDYAPHGTLRQHLPRGVPLEPTTILPYIKQVASALQYAHSQHLIHRDVKPENMLLRENDEVVLSDFGIALLAQSVRFQSTQEVFGTASYMAPEQIQGKAQPASDQYALGIVLYEWLCGTLPFHGSFTELCSQQLYASPPPLHEQIASISPEIEAVVDKVLAKNPDDRYPDVEAMASAFEAACQNEEPTTSDNELTVRRQPTTLTHTPPSQPTIAPTQYVKPQYPLAKQPAQEAPYSATEPVSVPTSRLSTASSSLDAVPLWKRGISRRMVIAGLGLAALVVVGGVTEFIISHHTTPTPAPSSVRFTAPPSPTTTAVSPQSLGTTLLTYKGHTGAVYALSWSPNGQYIASGSEDTTVRVWNIASGETLSTYQGHAGLFNAVFAVDWASNGSRIASGGADKTVQVWNAATGNRVLTYGGHSARVLALAWSPDTTQIASGGADKLVQVWDATIGTPLYTYQGHSDTIYTLAWSPDGKTIASGGADKTVQVWNAASGVPILTYRGHSETIYSLIWSPDGKMIASTGADRTVRVWDAASGKESYSYRGQSSLTDVFTTVAWSPTSSRIATGSTDKTVQVWDATTGKNAFTYRGHSNTVFSAKWSPQGEHIASGSADTTVRVWLAS